jgi:hypothetical protein
MLPPQAGTSRAGFQAFHLSEEKQAALALPQLFPGVYQVIGNGISLSQQKITLICGDLMQVCFVHYGYLTALSRAETTKSEIAFPHPDKRCRLSVLMGTLGTHLSSAQRPKFASLSLRGREVMAFSAHENIADFLRSSVPS